MNHMTASHTRDSTRVRAELAESAWFAVVHAYQACTRKYEQMLGAFGLTLPQFEALMAIERLGEQALPKHIADALLVTRGNVTGVLERLRAHALIRLDTHPVDGRARVASLTAEGARVCAQARAAASRFIEAQLAPFSTEEMVATRQTMVRMRNHLETLDPDALARGPSRSGMSGGRRR